MMKLSSFRVLNFRSVEDSGWIETDAVTALVGTNESGKTNVLIPLWKLNPAKEGEIIPTADFPRKHYNSFRKMEQKPIFIKAIFYLDDPLALRVSNETKFPIDAIQVVEVSKRFDNSIMIDFPNAKEIKFINTERVTTILIDAENQISNLTQLKSEERLKSEITKILKDLESQISISDKISIDQVKRIENDLKGVNINNSPKSSKIVPRYRQLIDNIKTINAEISVPHPRDNVNARKLVLDNLPKFVYYSTYGNLDSEIFLPHVIQNMTRQDIGLKEQAKARTLKVLFEFVKLQPREILELGRDFKEPNRQPSTEEVAIISQKKKERSILLQSASTFLTEEFRDWWKQGEYRFRFEADGEHFRIWVSDDKRPEEVELEGRSTGLQWFLSFYLVFLVERSDAHSGAILLLDEPGLSLHPLAQRDLSEFFNGLSKDNQLIYTCHSPFLVDADRLDRVRKVYVDKNGNSKVTSDLRSNDDDSSGRGSAYAVYAAIGLSLSESLMLGCKPVVVEGSSDQHYLIAIKNILVNSGNIRPSREIIFPPAGGAKGVKVVASLLVGRDEELPVVLFDSDAQGLALAQQLRNDLYNAYPDLVLEVGMFIDIENAEIEDLIPADILIQQVDHWKRTSDVLFRDEYQAGKPIVPQIEAWAKKYDIELISPGWKVELAIRVKQQLLSGGFNAINKETIERWTKMFAALEKTNE